jgi:acyl-CoA synthetase (AMP-forming)/AMP-acid ligase II
LSPAVFGRVADSFQIMGSLVLAEQAEQAVQGAVLAARSLVVVPSRSEGAGLTVVLESGRAWSENEAEEARQAIVSLFWNTEVDLLVVPRGSIPRTATGRPKRRQCWVTYVLER